MIILKGCVLDHNMMQFGGCYLELDVFVGKMIGFILKRTNKHKTSKILSRLPLE